MAQRDANKRAVKHSQKQNNIKRRLKKYAPKRQNCTFESECIFSCVPVELQWCIASIYPKEWLFVSKSWHTAASEQLLRDPRVNPNKIVFKYRLRNREEYIDSPIVWASTNGHIRLVKLLLKDSRVDPSVQNHRALVNACKHGHTEIVRLLINDQRSDKRAKRNLAIETTCCTSHVQLLCTLLHSLR
jgi:hypothetical protein